MELNRSLPWGAVWDELCVRAGTPAGADWLEDVARYERDVINKRG
jgi:L-rhamnose isomerase